MEYGDKYIGQSKGFVCRIIDREAFIVAADGQKMHMVNRVGTFIWQLLSGNITGKEIVDRVCERFDVDPTRAQADITDFLDKLDKKKMITTGDAPIGEVDDSK